MRISSINYHNVVALKKKTVTEKRDFNTAKPLSIGAFAVVSSNYDSKKSISVNNISFYGLFGYGKKNNSTPQDKLNAAIQNLEDRSIVLFADDFNNAKNLLNLSLNNITFPIENIYFVKNEFNMDSFAIYKDTKEINYKIFKLHPLSDVRLLTGGIDESDFSVQRVYVNNSDDPVVLQDGQNIKFGSYKNGTIIKTDFHSNLKSVFENEVEKHRYFDDIENAQKFNASMLMSLKENKGKVSKREKLTFADIGAQDENIKALEENVIFPLMYPDFYEGFRVNKGILLYGPPRCGKTMLANALANEAGVNFIKLGANDLTHAHIGKTEQNWRELFKSAIENQPTIIFIDEFDSISRARGGSSDTARFQDDIVNQLLTLMSDLEKSDDKVFVIAATNRADLLDKALINTGRFGLRLEVKPPDLKGMFQIYNINEKYKPLDEDVDKEKLCKMMYDNHFNGSDVVETFYVAHSFAMNRLGLFEKMRNKTITHQDKSDFKINQQDMESAIYRLSKQKTITS